MANDAPESADYRLIVWREGERFYIHLPELAILVHDADLQAAYDKLEVSCQAALKEYRDAGAEELIPPPDQGLERAPGRRAADQPPRRAALSGLASESAAFATKIAIAGVVGIFVLVIGGTYAVKSINRIVIDDLPSLGFWNLHTVAERLRNAQPAARETLRQDLRLIGRELRPFVDELSRPVEAPPPEQR